MRQVDAYPLYRLGHAVATFLAHWPRETVKPAALALEAARVAAELRGLSKEAFVPLPSTKPKAHNLATLFENAITDIIVVTQDAAATARAQKALKELVHRSQA